MDKQEIKKSEIYASLMQDKLTAEMELKNVVAKLDAIYREVGKAILEHNLSVADIDLSNHGETTCENSWNNSSGVILTNEEMKNFIVKVGRSELFEELKQMSEGNAVMRIPSSRYLKAIRATLHTLGFDAKWIDTTFRDALEEYYPVPHGGAMMRQFMACFMDEFTWDAVPLNFLFDLYIAWCNDINNTAGMMGCEQFAQVLKKNISAYPDWKFEAPLNVSESDTLAVEPIAKDFNLKSWLGAPCYADNAKKGMQECCKIGGIRRVA